MDRCMNRTMGALVLAVGMVAMASVAASRFYYDGSKSVIFSTEPIPCHVYLKAKHSIETNTNYVQDSFFQAQVQLIRLEPDILRMQQYKNFKEQAEKKLQTELDSLYVQEHPEIEENLSWRLQMSETETPRAFKASVVRVVDTLEGQSPGEEIVLSGSDPSFALKKMYYVLGYQDRAQRVHAVEFLRTPQEVREGKTVMGRFKAWVRWLMSECDNV